MPTLLFKKGQIPWNKGIPVSKEMKKRISDTLKRKGIKPKLRFVAYGKDHPFWKGDKVSYSGLHYWLRRKLGKPLICEHCGVTERRLTWANKSWKYKRDLNDWISLCYSCHKKYDSKITLDPK